MIERGQRYRMPSGAVVQVMAVVDGVVRCNYVGERGGLCRARGAVNFSKAAIARFTRLQLANGEWA